MCIGLELGLISVSVVSVVSTTGIGKPTSAGLGSMLVFVELCAFLASRL